MELRIASDALAKELAYYGAIIARKPSIPVIANVLVDASQISGTTLSATDLDVALAGPIESSVLVGGRMTIPAQKLLEIAKAVPGETLTLKLDGAQVKINGATYKSRLAAMPPDDFPTLPTVTKPYVDVPRAALRRLLAQVKDVPTAGDAKYTIAGALFVRDGGPAVLVATDTYRLAKSASEQDVKAAEPMLIPIKALHELWALLADEVDDAAATIAVAASDRHLAFVVDGRVLVSRTIDGTFPAWQRIMPKAETLTTATVPAAAFAALIKRVGLMSSESGRALTFALSKGSLRLLAKSAELGDADDAIAAEYDGADVEVRMKSQYVLDFLDGARGEKVRFGVKDARSAVLFSDGAAGYDVVVMPIAI